MSDLFAIDALEAAPSVQVRPVRYKIVLPGRCSFSGRGDYSCVTEAVDADGVEIRARARGSVGQRVTAWIRHLDRIEGLVSRHTSNGFVMTILGNRTRKAEIARQLVGLAQQQDDGKARRHERIKPRNQETTVDIYGMGRVPARLLDVSASGAALSLDYSPPVGEIVIVGSTSARVVRHLSEGIGVAFQNDIPFNLLDEDIVL